MSLALDRPEFAPPPQRGTPRAVVLALIAHALLIAALTWGVRWKSEGDDDAVEAELWSPTQQVAAPRIANPPPAPEPTPAPPPPPPPPPPPQAVRPDPTPAPKAPDIALEREKKLREEKEQREREQEQQRQQEKKRQEAQAKKEKDQLEAKKREEERQKELQQQKQAEQQKLAEQKKRDDAKKLEQQKAQLDKDRQDNLRRLMGQAGSTAEQTTGPRSGKGAGSGGPSAGYFGRVAALIKRNVVFDPNSISDNPAAEIQIQTSPDGTIVGTPRLVKSSGNAAWDDAALRAVQKTEVMPRDVDGRVPSPFPIISVRPKSQ
jgi:colicin import membrane protein